MRAIDPLPKNAVYGGYFVRDNELHKSYIIRADRNNELIPGRFNPDWKLAWIGVGGEEHKVWVKN